MSRHSNMCLCKVVESVFFLFYKNSLRIITYMETPYGGLWYAAGNPDGFRFGAVNRPSPPRVIYMCAWLSKQNRTVNNKTVSASELVGQIVKALSHPPAARRSPRVLLRRRWGRRSWYPGPPILPLLSWLSAGCVRVRAGVVCSARLCVRLTVESVNSVHSNPLVVVGRDSDVRSGHTLGPRPEWRNSTVGSISLAPGVPVHYE